MTRHKSGRKRGNGSRAIGDITGSKAVERHLRGLEQEWRSLVENIPDIIMTLDRDGTILFINRTPPGFTVEATIGAIVYDHVPAEHHDVLRRSLAGVFETGDDHDYEIAAPGPFGRTSWYFNRIGPVVRDGRVVAAAVIATDITERKRAEEALEQSEEKLRLFMDSAPVSFTLYDSELNLIDINKFGLSSFPPGTRKEDVIGKNLQDWVPEGSDRIAEYLKVVKTGEHFISDGIVSHPIFGERHMAMRAFRLGEGLGIIASDITGRKQAQETEERYRDLVENINEIVFAVGGDARITYISPVVTEVGGYSASEMVGRSFTDFLHPDDVSSAVEGFQRSIAGDHEPVELRFLSKSGELHWLRAFGRPILDGDRVVGLRGVLTDITERRRAEDALRQSEERYRDLAENLNDAIFEFDTSGRMTYVSPGMEEVSGYSPSEMIGRSIIDLVHPEDLSDVTAKIQERPFGNREPSEYRLLRKSGEPRWVHSLGSPMFEGDRVIGFRAVLTDITERKLAEQALRDNEERYRHLVESINEAIYEVDAGGRMTYISPVVEEAGGYSPSEIVGRPFADFVHPDDLSGAVENFQRAVSGHSRPNEYRLLSKSGEVLWVRSFGRPIFDGDRIVGVRGVLTDITDRKRAEEALRQSEEQFRLVTEAVPVLISYVDSQQRYRFNNKAYEEWFGRPRAEVHGQHIKDVLGDSAYQTIREHIESALSGQEVSFEGLVPYRDGGARHVSATYVPDVSEEGEVRGFVALVSDITERKRAEEALRESEERWRSLAENAPDIIMTVDADGTILFINRTVPGLAVESVIGTSLNDYLPPEHRERQRMALERVFETGDPQSYEIAGTGPHGGTSWYFSRIGPIARGDKVVAAILITTDITEERRAEEALRQSEDRYRTLVEAAPDVIYALSTDGTITSLNSTFESLTGWCRDDWLGKHFAPIVHPDDLPAVTEDFRLALQGEVPPVREYRMLTESGRYVTVETVPRPLIVDGEVVGTLGIARDLTPRKRMEETLQKAREEVEGKVERQILLQNPYGFSFREFVVLHLVTAGQSDKEIGITLGISPVTAQKHVENLRAKMKAASRTEAGVRALREGLLG